MSDRDRQAVEGSIRQWYLEEFSANGRGRPGGHRAVEKKLNFKRFFLLFIVFSSISAVQIWPFEERSTQPTELNPIPSWPKKIRYD
jgi:hypothetical protein